MDWDKLRVFLSVAEAGSFTHAGETLNLSQSAVSRQISGLEESLTVPLFHRHARGLILTEQGELLFQTAKEIFTKLAMTETLLTESREQPKGLIKVTTTFTFGSIWLAPRLRQFLDLYPDICVTLKVDDGELDLAMREADVAIRLTPPRQPELIQRHLVTFKFHLYAAAEYLAAHEAPTTLEDLHKHHLIAYGNEAKLPFPDANWLANIDGESLAHAIRLTVNSFVAIAAAISAGLGVGVLPDYLAARDPTLVRLLPQIDPPTTPAYFVYPEELRSSKRIAVFRDFLLRQIADSGF